MLRCRSYHRGHDISRTHGGHAKYKHGIGFVGGGGANYNEDGGQDLDGFETDAADDDGASFDGTIANSQIL